MSIRVKWISGSFFLWVGAFYIGINSFINDKLRADMEKILLSGEKKKAMFDIHEGMAPNYDEKTNNQEIRQLYNTYRRKLFSYAKGETLELGCGTGRSFEFYKKDTNVTAIDYSPKMLSFAEGKLNDRDYHRIDKTLNVKTMLIDSENLSQNFPEGKFDSVIDFNNFHSYCNPDIVYSEIKKVLKIGGNFIFCAKGKSNYWLIKDFYNLSRPTFFMRRGQVVNIDWQKYIEKDDDYEIIYKAFPNTGRTHIYILKLKSKNNMDFNKLFNEDCSSIKSLMKDYILEKDNKNNIKVEKKI
jgi:SAM-dependent methyltransferase